MTRLVRFSPNTEMRSLHREIDRLFDSFSPARRSNGDEPAQQTNWTPRLDLAETEEEYSLRLDVPGVSKKEIDINFQDGTLSVSGERTTSSKEEKDSLLRVERSAGRFYRSFSLPKTIQEDAISAEHSNGVLTIHVPKAEETKPRRITVS